MKQIQIVKEKISAILLMTLTGLMSFQSPSWALGLAARFGEVVVENAEVGKTYNLRETLKIPFGIENRSTSEVEVVVEFEAPIPTSLKKGYSAIPDPTWLKAIPATLRIGPKSQGFFDLLLSIPNDEKLNGHHYQAIVKARTINTGLMAVAVENSLRFSIGPGPESLKEEKRQKAMARLDFDVSPKTIYVPGVPVGESFDVKKVQNKVIRIANYAVDPLPFKLTMDEWNVKLYKPEGYEPIPDPSWIKFKTSEQKIEPEQIGTFQFVIQIPNKPEYKGKNYAALIRTGLSTGFWLDAPVTLFISTKE